MRLNKKKPHLGEMLIVRIFGRKFSSYEKLAGDDYGCKITGYKLKDKLIITKVEYDK